ncbi:L-serine-phosphatidylethanolamine phosphatidyltransferase [Caenorhabditis elegans]|uniref:L-serine-phosphatidylethanolamine phosphatidyltransferase n=1 Tax=Caenorhabditis elegans TaxID=6239 RepID=O44981_CAEEL|nr:L-serine-phosphatidylethanolamine phosphatidyltransferase [Caenorhabditis elegans]CCD68047.2 L-serine-phosphatidylethanolamine phosphatidyltransferase [Caenorhabditis elegans]|eukprot:NP_490804.3 Uncharacterized protein CELE_C54G6.3 [Caenorhabditis elegans]
MALLKVRDECTKLVGYQFLNSHICLCISLIQLLVCCWAVAQHVNSYMTHSKILKCDFLEGSLPLEAVDAVIFDIRLFHYLWGIRGCVAEYLDGGFGRLLWCVSHCLTLVFSIPVTFISHPKPCLFWPLLFQQSAYGICLLVLLLAALPRIVVVLASPQAAPLIPILFYLVGTALNFFHLYVYWHWYWHVSAMWNSVVRVKFGQRLENANKRSRRDKPIVPKEEIDDAVLHYVPANKPTEQQNHVQHNHISQNGIQQPKVILPPPNPYNTAPTHYRRRSSTEAHRYHPPRQPRSSAPTHHRVPADYPSDEEDDYDDTEGDDADIDDLPTPPPPIYAVRLTSDSWENQMSRPSGRRRLPATPNLPKHGELPQIFNIPHANV